MLPTTLPALFAQGDPTNAPTWFTFIPYILILFVFIFLMIAPARRAARQQAEMLAAMKKNDKVLTNSGIIGWVVQIRDTEVTLKLDENNANLRMHVLKSSISQVLAAGAAEGKDGA